MLFRIDLSLKVVGALGQVEDRLTGGRGNEKVQAERIRRGVGTELSIRFVAGMAVGGDGNNIVGGLRTWEIEGKGHNGRFLRPGRNAPPEKNRKTK